MARSDMGGVGLIAWVGSRTLGPTLAALLFLACIAPWTLRNWQAFHAFIPLRGNLGAELYMGNGPGSNGLLMEYDHPFQAPEQLRLYASLGEVRYVAMRGAAAKTFIAAHPAHFAADVARRIYFFWAGVPHPSDEAWYNEAGRTLNFAFLSVAGLFGLGLALAPPHPCRRTLRLGLPPAAHPLLPHHRPRPLPPPARAPHLHPRRLPLPVRRASRAPVRKRRMRIGRSAGASSSAALGLRMKSG